MNESQSPTDLQEKGEKNPLTKLKTVIERKKDKQHFHQLGVDLMPKNCHHSTTDDT